jgi:hypothetical protein
MSDESKTEKENDPYVVKQQVPSFAKEENQWELDMKAGAEAGDSKKKLIAVTTGAFAMVISVIYLLAVFALESRGDMKVRVSSCFAIPCHCSPFYVLAVVFALVWCHLVLERILTHKHETYSCARAFHQPAPPEAYGAFIFDHASSVLVALSNL